MEGQPTQEQKHQKLIDQAKEGRTINYELVMLLKAAIESGSAGEECIRKLNVIEQDKESDSYDDEYIVSLFKIAAEMGELRVLEWLDQNIYPIDEVDKNYGCAIRIAAIVIGAVQAGHQEVLDWLISYCREKYRFGEDLTKKYIIYQGYMKTARSSRFLIWAILIFFLRQLTMVVFPF